MQGGLFWNIKTLQTVPMFIVLSREFSSVDYCKMGNFRTLLWAVTVAVSSVEAKRLWFKQSADSWSEEALVIGNGRLGGTYILFQDN